jgi:hypothetical protein
MLVGEERPLTRVSTFRFGSLVMEGSAKAVEELLLIKHIAGIKIVKDEITVCSLFK